MNFSPSNVINSQIQQNQCNPEVCIKCGKRYFCSKYAQFLESYLYEIQGGLQQMQCPTSTAQQQVQPQQQVQKQMQSQLQEQDVLSLLDAISNLQQQFVGLSKEINDVKSNLDNNSNTNNYIQEDRFQQNHEEQEQNGIIRQNNLDNNVDLKNEISHLEVINPNDLTIYNPNQTDKILVEKKTIFGNTKWIEKKRKDE